MKVKRIKRVKRLKTKWVVIFTVICTLLSVWITKKAIEYIIDSLKEFEQKAEACDRAKGYTCSYYEVRNFIIKNK